MTRRTPTLLSLSLLLLLLSLGCSRQVVVEEDHWSELGRFQRQGHADVEADDGEVLHVEPRHEPRVRVTLKEGRATYRTPLDQIEMDGDAVVMRDGEEVRSRLVASLNPRGRYSFERSSIDSLSVELKGYSPPDWEPELAVGLSAGGPTLFASLDVSWFATSDLVVDFGLGNAFGPTGAASPYLGARFYIWDGALRPFLGGALVEHFLFGAVADAERTEMGEADYSADAVTTAVPRIGVDWFLYNGRVLVGAEVDLNLVLSSTLAQSDEGPGMHRDQINPWGGVRVGYVW